MNFEDVKNFSDLGLSVLLCLYLMLRLDRTLIEIRDLMALLREYIGAEKEKKGP